ncbi:SDR family NAD(P)-dependent oxidoreductase, partial [Candidatus Fermentibacterales bacterium]|nr:SDR family NAD(P)-dependent oxidoreductase [Candidatus Fermentibacterales bacterium]
AVDRDGAGLEALGQHDGLETLTLDITERQGVLEMVRRLESDRRRIRSVVVSAAVHSTHPAERLTDEIVDRVLDVNLASHIKLVRDLIPLMTEGGSIIGVSSIAACVGVPMSSMYSASKWGLEGFYESLWAEVSSRGINVSLVHPGNVNTGFNETGNTWEATGDSVLARRYRNVVSRIDSRYGIAPRTVASVIVRIISKKRPRFCYVVGGNARKANWAKKLLGRDLALRLMSKFFGFRGRSGT